MDTVLPPELIAAATRVVEANRAAGRRVVVAESCTGGLVAAALTEVPGCSDVVEGGFVTYSNDAKLGFLNVSSDVIDTFGAGSPLALLQTSEPVSLYVAPATGTKGTQTVFG